MLSDAQNGCVETHGPVLAVFWLRIRRELQNATRMCARVLSVCSFAARSLVGGSGIHVLRGATKRKYAVLAEDRIPVARSTLFPLLIRHPFERLSGNCFLCQKLSSKEVCFARCLIRKRRRRQIPAVSHSLCTNTCAQ